MAGQLQERDGEQYIVWNKLIWKPKMKQYRSDISGLIPDPNLNKLIVELINNSWPVMSDTILDNARGIYEPLLLKELNSFFKVVPFRKLFL